MNISFNSHKLRLKIAHKQEGALVGRSRSVYAFSIVSNLKNRFYDIVIRLSFHIIQQDASGLCAIQSKSPRRELVTLKDKEKA